MPIDCNECVFRDECAKTLKECRSHGGGERDLEILLEKQRRELMELRKKIDNMIKEK